MKPLIFVVLVLLLVVPAAAQDTYEDADGRYHFPLPSTWINKNHPDYAHFTNARGTINIYALVIAQQAVEAGISEALKVLVPGLESGPLQSSRVPLGSGEWTQNIYLLGSGEVLGVLALAQGESTYVLMIRGNQSDIQAENPNFLKMLTGFQIGTLPDLPAYIQPDTFEEQPLDIVSGDYTLPGTLTLPKGSGPFPAVVLVHGSGPNDRDSTLGSIKPFRDLAQGLASAGVAVLRYDKRTFVYGARSAPDLYKMTVEEETVQDAAAAVKLLQTLEQVNSAQIFVLGHSLGGMLAPRIALAAGEELAGIIIMAGLARTFEDSYLEQLDYIFTVDGQISPDEQALLDSTQQDIARIKALSADSDFSQTALGVPVYYWWDLQQYNPLAVAQGLDMAILVLQGERDYQVTMADFALWAEALDNHANAALKSYPALNHLFVAGEGQITPQEYLLPGFVDRAVIDDIAAWVLANERAA